MYSNELLEEFGSFLEVKMGLHFSKKRKEDLEKKVRAIAASFDFSDPSTCLQWLKKTSLDNKQMEILAQHLTVGETYFFRDESFFNCLEKIILPEIIQHHQKDRILKIWSAGCCSGEELYSIAILLHRLIPDLNDWHLTLLGTDINEQFLQKARKANYKKWSFRGIPKDILDNYFIKEKDSYTLLPKIKNMCSFIPLNLVEDHYPEEMDLIICHNVLMYFSEKQINYALHQLTKSLNKQGILSLASIEVPFVAEKNLTPFKYPGVVFHKKGAPHSPSPPPLPKKSIIVKPRIELKKKKLTSVKEIEKDIYQECLEAYREKHYHQVISKLNAYIEKKPLSKHLNEVQLLIWTYANTGDLIQGLEWCEKALHADRLQPITHYLHATLLEAKGDIPEAIKSLRAALFIDPHFIMAHYLLGLLEKQIGNESEAFRNIKIAKELLEKHPIDGVLPGIEELPHENLKKLIAEQYESFKNIT